MVCDIFHLFNALFPLYVLKFNTLLCFGDRIGPLLQASYPRNVTGVKFKYIRWKKSIKSMNLDVYRLSVATAALECS
jgi:hypothetical protein